MKGIIKVEDGSIDEFHEWIEPGRYARTDELIIETESGDLTVTVSEDGRIDIKK